MVFDKNIRKNACLIEIKNISLDKILELEAIIEMKRLDFF